MAEKDYHTARLFLDGLRDVYGKVKSMFGREVDSGVQETIRLLERAVGMRKAGNGAYEIKTLPDGRKYVQADREKVVFGDDPENWGNELETHINKKIRQGEDVELITTDGDVIKITEDSAWKVSDMTDLTEEEFKKKANAANHLDEIIAISKKTGHEGLKKDRTYSRVKADAYDYRTAYFRDYDGQYYMLGMSVSIDENGKSFYNIGLIRKRRLPTGLGSSAKGGAQNVGKPSNNNITHPEGSVNSYSTQNSEKDANEKTEMQLALERAGIDSDTFTEEGPYSINNLTPEQARAIKESEGLTEGDARGYNKTINTEGGSNLENSHTEIMGNDGTYRGKNSLREQGNDSDEVFADMGNRTTDDGRSEERREQRSGNTDRYHRQMQSLLHRSGEGVLRDLSRIVPKNADVKGRTLTNEVREYFKDTVTKDSNGYLVPFFHGTLSEFDEFKLGDIGFHLGTLEQAEKRIKDMKNIGKEGTHRVIEAYVNIKNPLYIPVDRGVWNAFVMSHQLLDKGMITEGQYNDLKNMEGFHRGNYSSEATKAIREILSKEGYDGIMYNNGFEGEGVSLIAFNANQIKYVTNQNPTSSSNMKYSINNLTPEQTEAVKSASGETKIKVSEFYTNSLNKEIVTPAVKEADGAERHKTTWKSMGILCNCRECV